MLAMPSFSTGKGKYGSEIIRPSSSDFYYLIVLEWTSWPATATLASAVVFVAWADPSLYKAYNSSNFDQTAHIDDPISDSHRLCKKRLSSIH